MVHPESIPKRKSRVESGLLPLPAFKSMKNMPFRLVLMAPANALFARKLHSHASQP